MVSRANRLHLCMLVNIFYIYEIEGKWNLSCQFLCGHCFNGTDVCGEIVYAQNDANKI